MVGFKPEDLDNEIALGGGLRYLASDNLFFDGGILFPVTNDVVTAGLVAAVTLYR